MSSQRKQLADAAAVLLRESGCTVRKYRSGLTGVAYTRSKDWGIEVPQPTTVRRFLVFAHEVGHQMLHRYEYGNRPHRWQAEVEACQFALRQAARFGIEVPEAWWADRERRMQHTINKARRAKAKDAPTVEQAMQMLRDTTNPRGTDGH